MAATRRPSVHIYQDPIHSPPMHQSSPRPPPQLQPSAMPLQALHNPPNNPDVVLAASIHPQPYQTSPQKPYYISPPKPTQDYNYINIPPPHMPNPYTDSPTKKSTMPPPRHIRPEPMSQQPLFTTFSSTLETFEQENYQRPPSAHDHFADFPEPAYPRKTLKRSYSDVAPRNDKMCLKPNSSQEDSTTLPEPEDMPFIEDDGNKPTYSYAQMIGMAILRAPNRRLTLAQIYDWISTTFAFYREDTKQGWHNSIRHNLSLNKAFKKMERPKGDAGKGSYWVIEPGMEASFLKDKNRKGNNLSQITMHATIMRPDFHSASQPAPELAPSPFISEPIMSQERPQTAPALPELSSDATLPASDPALNEDNDVVDMSHLRQPESSPLHAINSSPPIPAALHHRSGSSPSGRRQASSTRGHKRGAATMDDSGYFSSIESSILRPNKTNVILTSEIDVGPPRKKQRVGRAEEEIQRMRSSSHDITPSHKRTRTVNFSIAVDPESSSPLRPSSATSFDPATPFHKFKKPHLPPQSVSPNTQLHLHRKAMQDFTNSPIKSFGLFPPSSVDLDAWSPLKLPPLPQEHQENEFEIFSDPMVGMTPATPGFSSPVKPLKRPSLARASTTALSNIMHNASKLNSKTPSRLPASLFKSPQVALNGSPLKTSTTYMPVLEDENTVQDDLFDFESFENEDSDEALDLGKGFSKIGAPPVMKRPSLGGRSITSRF